MDTVNMHEAKTHLSRLARRAEAGETILLAVGGRPIARLMPLTDRAEVPRTGFMPDIVVPDDFDTFGAEEIRATFEDGE